MIDELLDRLAGLKEEAPAGFTDAVLERVGLVDQYAAVAGPIGPLFVAWSPQGVSFVAPGDDEDAFVSAYRQRVGRPLAAAETAPRSILRTRRFDLRGLSAFEQAVLTKTKEIPSGEVRTYAWVAREIGRPKAVRAVGSALGHNPVPVLIPCHRVVRSDGAVGEYAFGSPMKRALLGAEGVDVAGVERLGRSGVQFVGSDTTGVFCLPACRDARRITDAHRVTFRSARHAADAGFRPCRHCRPAEPVSV